MLRKCVACCRCTLPFHSIDVRVSSCRSYSQTRTAKTYYEILGVRRNAPHAEIKEAYIRMCKEVHPDRGGAVEGCADVRQTEVNRAYEILSRQSTRRAYDSSFGSCRTVQTFHPRAAFRHRTSAEAAKHYRYFYDNPAFAQEDNWQRQPPPGSSFDKRLVGYSTSMCLLLIVGMLIAGCVRFALAFQAAHMHDGQNVRATKLQRLMDERRARHLAADPPDTERHAKP